MGMYEIGGKFSPEVLEGCLVPESIDVQAGEVECHDEDCDAPGHAEGAKSGKPVREKVIVLVFTESMGHFAKVGKVLLPVHEADKLAAQIVRASVGLEMLEDMGWLDVSAVIRGTEGTGAAPKR